MSVQGEFKRPEQAIDHAQSYDSNCDIGRDNKISLKGLNTLLSRYGRHYR